MDRSDFTAAVNLLRRSLGIDPGDSAERGPTLYHLGLALGGLDDYTGLVAAFDEAIDLATRSGDRSLEWRARIHRSERQMWADPFSGSPDGFRDEFLEAIQVFDELGDEVGLAGAWTKMVIIDFWSCRYDRAMIAARQAVDHGRRSMDGFLLDEALLAFRMAEQWGSVTPEEGIASLDELTGDITRSRRYEATDLAVRGVYHGWLGAFEEARTLIMRAIQVAEGLGLGIEVAMYQAFLGVVETEALDPVAAERCYRRSYEIADQLGWEGYKTTPSGQLALTLVELGRLDEADKYAAITTEAADTDDLGPQVMGRSARAVALAARGRFEEGERLAREAIAMFAEAENPNDAGTIWMNLARVQQLAGKTGDAGEAARSALAFFERKGNRPSSDAARTFLQELEA